MKINVCLPYMERTINRKTIIDWCDALEQGPYHTLSIGERITGYSVEMRNILAFAAARTERIRICASLYVLPMHNAVWAAKEIATLDLLSEGRLTVTVGVGGREKDYRAVGANFKNRHARMDEQIAVMKDIWRGGVPFEGCDEIGPTPVQVGGPPILAGALGPKAIARASKWADGIYGFAMNGEKADTQKLFSMAESSWQESEREKAPLKVGGFWYSLADDSQSRLKNYVYNYMKFTGDEIANMVANSVTRHNPKNILQAMDDIESLGCDELYFVPATDDIEEVHRLTELLASR